MEVSRTVPDNLPDLAGSAFRWKLRTIMNQRAGRVKCSTTFKMKYSLCSAFLLSLNWAPRMSRDVPANSGFIHDKATVACCDDETKN